MPANRRIQSKLIGVQAIILVVICAFLTSGEGRKLLNSQKLDALRSREIELDFTSCSNIEQCLFEVESSAKTKEGSPTTILSLICNSTNQGLLRFLISNFEVTEKEVFYYVGGTEIGFNDDICFINFTNNGIFELVEPQFYDSIKEQMFAISVLSKSSLTDSSRSLPFNLLSQKTTKVFADQLGTIQLKPKEFSQVPFLQSFWNEYSASNIILSWIPYLSKCDYRGSRVPLYNLLQPIDCREATDFFSAQQPYLCQNRKSNFRCIIEEYELMDPKSYYFWFESSRKTKYYLLPDILTRQEALMLFKDPAAIDNLTLASHLSFVPVEFYRTTSYQLPLTHLRFQFEVEVSTTRKFTLHRAQIYAWSQKVINDNEVSVEVFVQYPGGYQLFKRILLPAPYYVLIGLVLSSFLIVLSLSILHSIGIRVRLLHKVKHLLIPATKGFLYSFFCLLLSVFMVLLISSTTSYATISGNFGGDPVSNDNISGRNGLSLLLVGLFMIGKAIDQSSGVHSEEEIAQLLVDEAKVNSFPAHTISDEGDTHQARSEFIVNMLISHRKELFTYITCVTIVILFLMYQLFLIKRPYIALLFILIHPVVIKLLIFIVKNFIMRDLLYLQSLLAVYQMFSSLHLLKTATIQEFWGLFAVKIFAQSVLAILLELGAQRLAVYLSEKLPLLPEAFDGLRQFAEPIILDTLRESAYQRSLFYAAIFSSRIISCLIKPVLLLLIIVTRGHNGLCSELQLTESRLTSLLLMVIGMAPFELFIVLAVVPIFQQRTSVRLQNLLCYAQFRFKRRKINWMNDVMIQNGGIHPFFRQFEKFSLSSQLYTFTFTMTGAMCAVLIGIKVILVKGYIVFNDPALMLLMVIIPLFGSIISFTVSLVAVKLRLYEQKDEGKRRTKLESLERMCVFEDYRDYLDLHGVKNHFILFNSNWIVENLQTLLTKEDFEENNHALINKYKFYKSLSKRKTLEKKKQLKNQHLLESADLQMNRPHPSADQVIKVPAREFSLYARPLFYQWFYLSKQNLYLRRLIAAVKESKAKSTCEFCIMDIELETIEKKDFTEIVNLFRVYNVGRIFSDRSFRIFYEHHQQFITVCSECKERKCYLEKKKLKNAEGICSRLMLRWLIHSRSRLLHFPSQLNPSKP